MNLDEFEAALLTKTSDADLESFSQQTILHGTPFVFQGRENDYFAFKQRVCGQLNVHHTEVTIVGSGKLGFSPAKRTSFSLDSDIDVAIVSTELWEKVFELGLKLEYRMRSFEISLHRHQMDGYVKYLRYIALGWVRPDLIPNVDPMEEFKQSWFDLFRSLSFDRSEVGNYKVSAGLYRSQNHLEKYTVHSLRQMRRNLEVEAER